MQGLLILVSSATFDLLRSCVQKVHNMLVFYHLQKISVNSGWYVNEHDFSVCSTGKFLK